MTTVTSAWRSTRFRRLWAAGVCSGVGTEIGELALPALALIVLTATPAEASWVRAATVAPFLLVTMWFGVVVDRRSRRALMLTADIARAAVLLTVIGLALLDVLTVPVLIAATFLVGVMAVLYQLADFAFLPQIVAREQLIDANAKLAATGSVLQIGGAGIGGLAVQSLTAPFALLLNAVGYLGSAVLLGTIGRVPVPVPPAPSGSARRSSRRDARDGMRTLLRHPTLRVLVAEATLWNFGNEIFMIALTVHILEDAAGPLVLGLIVSVGALGAVGGSLASSGLTARFGYGRSLVISLAAGNTAPLLGVTVAVVAPDAALPAVGAAFLISGVGIGIANAQATSLRQLAVRADLRGRVNAGYRFVSWGALSVGALAGGAVITATGTVTSAIIGAAVMAVATLPVALSSVRRVRRLDAVSDTASFARS